MEYKNEYYSADNDGASYSNNSENRNQLDKIKQIDRGYNRVWRNIVKNERIKRTKIELYTTSGFGNHIRDAETGEYYPYLVQSRDEDLFFSVILATGECRSRNGSNKLFYLSPEKYMKHMQVELDNDIILSWNEKRDNRLRERKEQKEHKSHISSIVVK
jgi:hypothetical protein